MHWFESWVVPTKCILTEKPAHQVDLSSDILCGLKPPEKVCPQCCEPTLDGAKCGRCLATPPAFDRTQAGFMFEDSMIDLIYGLKYQKQLAYGRLLADLLVKRVDSSDVEALLAVPIHDLRWRDRGFNQSEILANNLSRHLKLPVIDNAVIRVKDTPSQTGLTLMQRQNNLKGAFKVNPEVLQGFEKIAIVDDVMTTHSTMQILAQQIKKHSQVKYIEAWVVAKTP